MKLHGNLYVVGSIGAPGLAIDDAPLAAIVAETIKDDQVGVRVGELVVVGKVTHAEVVDALDGRHAVSIDLELDDEAVKTLAPALLETSSALLEDEPS